MANVIVFEDLITEAKEKRQERVIDLNQYTYILDQIDGFRRHYKDDYPTINSLVWKLREKIRNKYYREKIEFHEDRFREMWRFLPSEHYVHPSMNKDEGAEALVAYTKDEEKGQKDIQTVTRFGKYLTAVNKKKAEEFKYTEKEINEFANAYKQERIDAKRRAKKAAEIIENDGSEFKDGLHITQNPMEIAHGYRTCSTSSCMSYDASKWGMHLGQVHIPEHFDDETKRKLAEFERAMTTDYSYEEQVALTQTHYNKGITFMEGQNRPVVHPTHMFGLMPDVGVAFYYIKGKVVARAVVNIKTKKYMKAYGQDHIRNMLSRIGYSQGCITPFEMPRLHTLKQTNSTAKYYQLIMPFIDGNGVGVKTGIKHATMEFISADCEKAKRTSLHCFSARNYSTGYVQVSTNLACKECGCIVNDSGMLTNVAEKALCPVCVVDKLEEMESDYVAAWTWQTCSTYDPLEDPDDDRSEEIHDALFNSFTSPKITLVPSNRAVEVENFDISQIHNHISAHTLSRRSKVMVSLFGKETRNQHMLDMTKRLIDKQGDKFYVEEDCDMEAITEDVVTGKNILCVAAYKVLLPDGKIGLTAAQTYPIKGRLAEKAVQFLGARRIPANMDTEQYRHMSLVLCKPRTGSPANSKSYYAVADECIDAIIDLFGNTSSRPRSLCTYSFSTKRWYCGLFASRYLGRSSLPQPLAGNGFSDHDASFMEANKVIYVAIPTFASVEAATHSWTELEAKRVYIENGNDPLDAELQDSFSENLVYRTAVATYIYTLWAEEWTCAKQPTKARVIDQLVARFGIKRSDKKWRSKVKDKHFAQLLGVPQFKEPPIQPHVSASDETINTIST